MSSTITSLDQLDYDISVAYIAARCGPQAHSNGAPAPRTPGAVDEAERRVDRLLDERFAAQQQWASACAAPQPSLA